MYVFLLNFQLLEIKKHVYNAAQYYTSLPYWKN